MEIATNKEYTARRKVIVGKHQKVILYKPRVPIDRYNVKNLMFLDALTRVPLDILDELEFSYLKKFASQLRLKELLSLLRAYPKKTAEALQESEAAGVFA